MTAFTWHLYFVMDLCQLEITAAEPLKGAKQAQLTSSKENLSQPEGQLPPDKGAAQPKRNLNWCMEQFRRARDEHALTHSAGASRVRSCHSATLLTARTAGWLGIQQCLVLHI